MQARTSRRDFLAAAGAAATGALSSCVSGQGTGRKGPPNVVLVFLDDSGWADFRPFGDTAYPTPNVNRLAEEGCCFHRFYVPQAVCSASRSALLTGCYPGRTKVFGAHPPRARGLDPAYATLGQVLQPAGYTTAVFGKWHLGDQPETRPPVRGFDESCGLMYSNDMWKYHPGSRNFDSFPLQFWENGSILIESVTPEDQTTLTSRYTEHAVDFIRRHAAKPFFLYVPHSMPHVPLFCAERFRGKSGAGLYGDVMMELDWSVGEIMNALREAGVEDNTLFLFTSDNGPWLSYGDHAGKTPFREGKATAFDGGIRSACIARFPGKIPAGTISRQMISSIDVLPTVAFLAGAELPANPVDGKNVWDLMRAKPGAVNPHEYYPFSTGRNFEGIVSADGRWKLHLPHNYRVILEPGSGGKPGKQGTAKIELSLFDMEADPHETTNVIDRYPDVAERLKALAEAHRDRFYARKPG